MLIFGKKFQSKCDKMSIAHRVGKMCFRLLYFEDAYVCFTRGRLVCLDYRFDFLCLSIYIKSDAKYHA